MAYTGRRRLAGGGARFGNCSSSLLAARPCPSPVHALLDAAPGALCTQAHLQPDAVILGTMDRACSSCYGTGRSSVGILEKIWPTRAAVARTTAHPRRRSIGEQPEYLVQALILPPQPLTTQARSIARPQMTCDDPRDLVPGPPPPPVTDHRIMLDVEYVLGLPYSANSLPFRNKDRLVERAVAFRAWTQMSVWQLHRTRAFKGTCSARNFSMLAMLRSPCLLARTTCYNAQRTLPYLSV